MFYCSPFACFHKTNEHLTLSLLDVLELLTIRAAIA